MPKQKTHRGAAKRLKVTASGHIKHKSTNKRHLLRKRTKARKRRLNVDQLVRMCDFPRVQQLLLLKSPR